MAFNEKPLALNDELDSVVVRQDDTVATKLFTMSIDELGLKGETKILFCKLMKINVIAGLEMVK